MAAIKPEPKNMLDIIKQCEECTIIDVKKCMLDLTITQEPKTDKNGKIIQRKGRPILQDKVLGEGNYGITYQLEKDEKLKKFVTAVLKTTQEYDKYDYVLKRVKFLSSDDKKIDEKSKTELIKQKYDELVNEVTIARYTGNVLHISPKIFSCWICNNEGYFIMERFSKTYQHEYPSGYQSINLIYNTDETLTRARQFRLASWETEIKVIRLLETMIANDIVHNDIHPENIGINKDGEPILFDFGFSYRTAEKELKKFMELKNKNEAENEHVNRCSSCSSCIIPSEFILMSHLYMIIEKYEVLPHKVRIEGKYGWYYRSPLYYSYFYQLIYIIRQGKYIFNGFDHYGHIHNLEKDDADTEISLKKYGLDHESLNANMEE